MAEFVLSPIEESEEKVKLEDLVSFLLKDNFIEDGNMIGYFDEPETFSTIVQRIREKGFSYCIRDSDYRKKLKGNPSDGGDDLKNEFSQHSVFYQLKAMSIKFFGLPFTVEKTTHYQCAFGRKYYKTRSEQNKTKTGDTTISLPMKKRKNIVSKKMGCLAKMTLKKIVVYPEYKLEVGSDWRKKKSKIECLRKDLSNKDKLVDSFSRYYLSISLQSSHNHPPIVSLIRAPIKQKKVQKNAVKRKRKESEESQEVKSVSWETSFPTATSSLPKVHHIEESPDSVTIQDSNFLSTLVKFPGDSYEEAQMKPMTIGLEIGFDEPDEPRTFQIQAIQYHPSPQDLQILFRDRLKRLYTLSENCFNSALLIRLLDELEQVEISLRNDIGYDPNSL